MKKKRSSRRSLLRPARRAKPPVGTPRPASSKSQRVLHAYD